jgi:hypothetical protein
MKRLVSELSRTGSFEVEVGMMEGFLFRPSRLCLRRWGLGDHVGELMGEKRLCLMRKCLSWWELKTSFVVLERSQYLHLRYLPDKRAFEVVSRFWIQV